MYFRQYCFPFPSNMVLIRKLFLNVMLRAEVIFKADITVGLWVLSWAWTGPSYLTPSLTNPTPHSFVKRHHSINTPHPVMTMPNSFTVLGDRMCWDGTLLCFESLNFFLRSNSCWATSWRRPCGCPGCSPSTAPSCSSCRCLGTSGAPGGGGVVLGKVVLISMPVAWIPPKMQHWVMRVRKFMFRNRY